MDNTPQSDPTGRLLGGYGVGFALMLAVAVALTNGQPGATGTAGDVVTYYADHRTSVMVSSFAALVAAVLLGLFAGAVFSVLQSGRTRATALSVSAAVGAAVYAVGIALTAALQFTLIAAAHDHQPAVALALNYFDAYDFSPMIAGLALFMLATGAAAVRTRSLPGWLGWSAVVIGALAIAGPLREAAFFLAPVWALVTGIVALSGRFTTGSLAAAAPVPSG